MTTVPELPRAPEVHSAIRSIVDPVVRSLGYLTKRGGAAGGSLEESDGRRIFFWFQLHPKATDSYMGGEFVIEFEHTLGGSSGRALSGRARFDQLLTRPELEAVLAHQNEVIASLPRPPASHVAGYPESLRETYLESFAPQGRFTPGNLWLRYHTLDHVRDWAQLISGLMPSVLVRAKRMDPHVLYMGSEIDLDADPLRSRNPVVIKQTPFE